MKTKCLIKLLIIVVIIIAVATYFYLQSAGEHTWPLIQCGDGHCHDSELMGQPAYCPEDCGGEYVTCGDGICTRMEGCYACPEDCGACPPRPPKSDCLTEGGSYLLSEAPEPCCEGLVEGPKEDLVNGECIPLEKPRRICTNCGDGWCGIGENTCNCPDDCEYFYAFMDCVRCMGDDTEWEGHPCCTDTFDSDCEAQGGVVEYSDLHPVYTSLKGCFKIAPDAGHLCATNKDCLSQTCDLEYGVTSGACALIDTVVTDQEEDFWIKTYECTTSSPGRCMETRESRRNPGGVSHYFQIEGTTLTEIRESGPIM